MGRALANYLSPQLHPQDIVQRIRNLSRRIRDLERAPMPEGPVLPEEEVALGGVMMALVDFTNFPNSVVYILKFDGKWTLVSTLTATGDALAVGADGGFASTPSYAVKTPTGNYIISVDSFMDTYPYFNFLSEDGGVTWTEIFEDVDAVDNGAIESANGTLFGFKSDGSPFTFRIYKNGSAVFTASDDDLVYLLQHIAAHPTNANYVACAGFHNIVQPGPDDVIPWVVATSDGGSSWSETELPDTRMSPNSSWEHLNLTFLASGRLVYLTMHETSGIDGETGPDGLRIWYADPPFTSWTEVNESSLWDLTGDEDWEGGPITGGLNGTDKALFFIGHETSGSSDIPRVFMSRSRAASWVELQQPPLKTAGIHYDPIGDALYALVHAIDSEGVVLYQMKTPGPGKAWKDVTRGIPITLNADTFPFTQQAIWGY